MKSKAYAAGTIINALALGYGSAFGLNMLTKVRLSVEDDLKRSLLIENGEEKESKIVDRVLSEFGIRGAVEVESEIPKGSGLGSSSAFMNALLLSVYKHLGIRLLAHEILRLNAKLSLELGISYTGAFDDASASLLGGIVISNNREMKLISWEFKRAKAIILIPEWGRGKISLDEIRRNPELVEKAVELALNGDYREAMILNSKHYCDRIGYPFEVIEKVRDLECFCGLSGNGPTFVAFGSKDSLKEVEGIWSEYGKVVWTNLAETPSDEVVIKSELYDSSGNM